MMTVDEAIKARYSCRSYSEKPVDKKIVWELLELANLAPSAGNHQNRQFGVVTDEEDRKWLAGMNNQPHLAETPVVILVTIKRNIYFKDREDYIEGLAEWEMKPSSELSDLEGMLNKWAVSDAAVAAENLMLAATGKGLATCWLGIMDFEGVRERFGLGAEVEPVCLVTLGYEKEKPKYRTGRKKTEELVLFYK